MTLGESLNLSATVGVNKLKIIPAASRKESKINGSKTFRQLSLWQFLPLPFCVCVCVLFFNV